MSLYRFRTPDLLVGRNADGDRIYVEAHLYDREASLDTRTTEHARIVGGYPGLGVTYSLIPKGARRVHSCGANAPAELRSVVTFAPGWDAAKAERLAEIADRWHLNDMRAACAHMVDLPDDPTYDARKDITCPVTGYRYGTAWLVEPLPVDVIDFIVNLGEGN
jgi:hypothetical protein